VKTIPFKQVFDRWMKDPEFRHEYERIGPAMELAFQLAEARRRAGLSQAELAQRMGTSQSTIARLENGRGLPSARTLTRFAEATGARIHIQVVPAE
jgi:DNA-binding XRE family transcriptional regulator